MTVSQTFRTQWNEIWQQSRPLMATALVMLVAFVASLVGIFVDHRVITGAPAWLKPAKFAISTAIFAATMAWLMRQITIWPRFMRALGWLLAAILVLEVGIIDVQAARGTTSHFNISTPLDAALFSIMGTAIGALWLATICVFAALCRQQFADRAWGWALRLGLLTTILGSAVGGLMLRPKPEQLQVMQTRAPSSVGGHTVGAPDGGPGLPGVGWSTEHGDLRVPHFFGLHGVQAIPLLAWVVRRKRRRLSQQHQTGLVFVAGSSYIAFVLILIWQALRGQSFVAPDQVTIAVLAGWAVATGVAAGAYSSPGGMQSAHANPLIVA